MKKLMAVGAILITVGSLFYLLFATPHVPLVDANRTVLAETEETGYCAGIVFGQTRGMGDEARMAECQEMEEYATDIDWDAVTPAFCRGLEESMNYPAADCELIMVDQQFWPTLGGSITNAWNRAFPYPGRPIVDSTSDGRGNDRDSNTRDTTDLYRP